MTTTPEYLVGSREYVKAKVTDTTGANLTGTALAILVGGTSYPAQWVDSTPAPVRTCRTTSLVDFTGWAPGYRTLRVAFTDSPEVPIIDAGQIVVRA